MDMNECDKVGLSLWFSVKNAEHKILGGNPKSDWCPQGKICEKEQRTPTNASTNILSQVREEYRRRGLARVRDKALGFILGMVSYPSSSFYSSSFEKCVSPFVQLSFGNRELNTLRTCGVGDPAFYPASCSDAFLHQVIPKGVLLYIALSISCR